MHEISKYFLSTENQEQCLMMNRFCIYTNYFTNSITRCIQPRYVTTRAVVVFVKAGTRSTVICETYNNAERFRPKKLLLASRLRVPLYYHTLVY